MTSRFSRAANDNKRPSYRNPLAALANTLDYMASQEPNDLYRASARRLAEKARQLARQEPPPNPPSDGNPPAA